MSGDSLLKNVSGLEHNKILSALWLKKLKTIERRKEGNDE